MRNILLVDDDTHTLEALALRIGVSLRNCNILTALDGARALKILRSVPVQFILTDVQKPLAEGCRIIDHRNRICPHVPVFAVTGDKTRKEIRKLKAMRVSECIGRPFDFEDLAWKIVLSIPADPKDRKAHLGAEMKEAPAGAEHHS